MSKSNSGGPAFPTVYDNQNHTQEGMTLRDWFAGQVLAGMTAGSGDSEGVVNFDFEATADACYSMADAMLAAKRAKA